MWRVREKIARREKSVLPPPHTPFLSFPPFPCNSHGDTKSNDAERERSMGEEERELLRKLIDTTLVFPLRYVSVTFFSRSLFAGSILRKRRQSESRKDPLSQQPERKRGPGRPPGTTRSNIEQQRLNGGDGKSGGSPLKKKSKVDSSGDDLVKPVLQPAQPPLSAAVPQPPATPVAMPPPPPAAAAPVTPEKGNPRKWTVPQVKTRNCNFPFSYCYLTHLFYCLGVRLCPFDPRLRRVRGRLRAAGDRRRRADAPPTGDTHVVNADQAGAGAKDLQGGRGNAGAAEPGEERGIVK